MIAVDRARSAPGRLSRTAPGRQQAARCTAFPMMISSAWCHKARGLSDSLVAASALVDRGVELRDADAAVVVGVGHAAGLEQRVHDGAAVVAEPVGDPAWLADVPGAWPVVDRRVAEVNEEAGTGLRLADQVDATRLQAGLDRREDPRVHAVVGVLDRRRRDRLARRTNTRRGDVPRQCRDEGLSQEQDGD